MEHPVTVLITESTGAPVIDESIGEASGIGWSTQFPGGMYGPGSFFVPQNPTRISTPLRGGMGVKIVDGGRVVYEGKISEINTTYRGGQAGHLVACSPPASALERAGIDRRWVDDRIDAAIWVTDTTVNGAELATDDRDGRLRWTPKGVAWANGEYARLEYTMPTGETVGRVEYSYDMQEAAQAWELQFAELPATVFHSVTASGTGTKAANTTTAPQALSFDLVSKAAQTPTEDGTYYAQISDVKIYATRSHGSATLGNVNVYEVALDIIDELSGELSVDLTGLDTGLTLALSPFVTQGWQTFGSIIAAAAAFGDTAYAPLLYYLDSSENTSDGLPRLVIDQHPALTAWDYEIRARDAGIALRENVDEVVNYVVVQYTDATGKTATLTPADDATLTDADSVTAYGRRLPPGGALNMGSTSALNAAYFGRRYLARHAFPTWQVSSSLTVSHLLDVHGARIPAGWIQAGQRLRIIDVPDVPNGGALGLTLLITGTDYDSGNDTVSLSVGGAPDDLAVLLARISSGMFNLGYASSGLAGYIGMSTGV